jgi:hypothetical protein
MPRLEQIGDALWLAEGDIVSFYGFAYPTRSVIARLASDRLWVWSPVSLAADLRAEVERLGRVAHLVSPNKLHRLHLAEWKAAYPDAKVWGPRSSIRRSRDLPFAGALEDAPPSEWGSDIDQARFCGSFAMDEIVFFHRPSKTAIVADLIQAFDDAFLSRNWTWTRGLARLDGIHADHPGAPREWRFSFVDRAAARSARDKALGWNCERVVIAHGAWRRSGGREFLQRALAWLGGENGR